MSGLTVEVIDELRHRGFIDPMWRLTPWKPGRQFYPTQVESTLHERVAAMQAAYPKRRKFRKRPKIASGRRDPDGEGAMVACES